MGIFAGLFHPNAWTPAILKLNSGIGKGAFHLLF